VSLLVLSISHHTAPIALLGRVALDADTAGKLGGVLVGEGHVDECVVLSTCNRTEVYVAAERFHPTVEAIGAELAALTGLGPAELHASCAVFYDSATVSHAFSVAAGLDSMVVGEQQILGQVRGALTRSQADGTVGTALNALFQQALRVGKRVQAETGIGTAGRSLVSAGLNEVVARTGPLAGRRAVVLGAGMIAGLAAHTLADAGVAVCCVNRTLAKAQRLAGQVGGTARPLAELGAALSEADLLVSCAGARDLLVHRADLMGTPVRAVLDLALPADVDPAVAGHVELIDLDTLLAVGAEEQSGLTDAVEQARGIVRAEVSGFGAARRAVAVAPTVVALRTLAADVTAAELGRLDQRLPDLSERERAEVATTVRRVVDKLLHTPTVRVQQIAQDSTVDYAAALRELFALDPQTIAAVTTPKDSGE